MRDVICDEAVPFHPYCGVPSILWGVVTRTRNVSEYMLVLTVCLVSLLITRRYVYRREIKLLISIDASLKVTDVFSSIMEGLSRIGGHCRMNICLFMF